MTLEDLGYHEELGRYQQMQHLHSFEIGRIAAEHRERYTVLTEKDELEAEVIGQLRFSASDRSDFPAVGDWVAVSVFNESDAIIHAIYPRRSILERQAVGKFGEKQIIAANIDYALIIQAVDRDFNLNRLERYLAISYAGNIEPVIILSKIDLVNKDELAYLVNKIAGRIRNIHIIALSNMTGDGLEELIRLIQKGKTYCFLGSTGVGKSTLINKLAGKDLLRTNSLSKSTKKGRHVTSHREMVVLEKGGILVDNPGMREIGLADTAGGLETTFDLITELSTECKYSDCKHIQEDGCAILASVDNGDLDRAAYENYLKMVREKIHFQSSIAEKRRKDKEIGRMIKAFMKHRKQNE
ncbi:MAG: ribosome biogenesis GTPase RsgA [Bacteroides sp. SM23_62]|nr:MAG: ribosome biogenesis GTPase RsgA [Bacteroides sp. SM23_62]